MENLKLKIELKLALAEIQRLTGEDQKQQIEETAIEMIDTIVNMFGDKAHRLTEENIFQLIDTLF